MAGPDMGYFLFVSSIDVISGIDVRATAVRIMDLERPWIAIIDAVTKTEDLIHNFAAEGR